MYAIYATTHALCVAIFAGAVITIALKTGAFFLTGSVGLLSDALESLVNLVAAILALAMLIVAARPPDEAHAYGHNKAEYLSSGVEGALVLVADVGIVWTALPRLLAPEPLAQVGLGRAISVAASAVNFGIARTLFRAGRLSNSIVLEADAHHLMTDVWTSVGVLVGIVAVPLTGWQHLDPIVALVVAANSCARTMIGATPDSAERRIAVSPITSAVSRSCPYAKAPKHLLSRVLKLRAQEMRISLTVGALLNVQQRITTKAGRLAFIAALHGRGLLPGGIDLLQLAMNGHRFPKRLAQGGVGDLVGIVL